MNKNSRTGHLLVVGSMNMDLSVQVHEIPKPGETILGSRVQQLAGGKGSNQATAAAKLGAHVSLIAMVGDDPFGTELINIAEESGVETKYIQVQSRERTGTALITVSDEGENAIVVAPGANSELTSELVEASILNIGDFDIMSSCLEIPFESVAAAFAMASNQGAKTLLNASPFNKKCLSLIPLTDYLIVNEHELREMCGTGVDEIEKLRVQLAELGASKVVVTLGEDGALYLDTSNSGLTELSLPAPKIRAVDTTGCGDAFAGALAAEIANGSEIKDALELAIKAGSYAATKFGAQPSYGTRTEVLAL